MRQESSCRVVELLRMFGHRIVFCTVKHSYPPAGNTIPRRLDLILAGKPISFANNKQDGNLYLARHVTTIEVAVSGLETQ